MHRLTSPSAQTVRGMGDGNLLVLLPDISFRPSRVVDALLPRLRLHNQKMTIRRERAGREQDSRVAMSSFPNMVSMRRRVV